MKKILLFAALMTATTICLSKTNCTKSTELEPSLCQIKLPKISVVKIKKNAAGITPTGNIEEYDNCERFILTPLLIKRYFQKTKLFNETDFHYYKNVTPCYASGTLIFADGRKATWDIDAHQNGTLKIGKQKEIYLLCDSCNFKPW